MASSQLKELIDLLARESYFERTVTLSSGHTSNYYLDCRRTLMLPRGAFLAGELLIDLVTDAGVAQVGGMAAAAIPVTDAILAAAFRRNLELTGFFVRKETKPHGLQQRIEGAFRAGVATAIVEDTVTTGGSSVDAAAAARAAGADVTCVIALVDRGEGGAEAFAKAGLAYRFLVSADDLRLAHERLKQSR
jgi:orotate phosphoribosyltransferase